MGFILFITAIAISGIAAFYSIVGLAAIFAAAKMPIIIMGSVLEVGKLVTASWLYQNWKKANRLLKIYFTTAVVVLMLITSMGIFGFLSKAHIDQTMIVSNSNVEIDRINLMIDIEQRRLKNAQQNLDNLEKLVSTLSANDAAWTRRVQRKERETIKAEIKDASQEIANYQEELVPLQKEQVKLEAEVGPIKYIAELVYGDANRELLESAVRLVIMLIIFVFDPLAVLLLIAANMALLESRKKIRKKKVAYVDEIDTKWKTETRVVPEEEKKPISAYARIKRKMFGKQKLVNELVDINKKLEDYSAGKIEKHSFEERDRIRLEQRKAELEEKLK